MSYWWACQGKYFKRDNAGGFIQARQQGKNGYVPFHWENVSKVRSGDFIIAYKNGYIVSIGTAIGNTFTTPSNIDGSSAWQVPVAWTNLITPFLAQNVWGITQPLFDNQKRMPLNKNGRGNNGYLFEIGQQIFNVYVNYGINNGNPNLSIFVNN